MKDLDSDPLSGVDFLPVFMMLLMYRDDVAEGCFMSNTRSLTGSQGEVAFFVLPGTTLAK